MNTNAHLTGRDWIEQGYLPQLSGRVLWVGVADYTAHYYKLVKNPELFETIDVLPEREKWGSPNNHHVGDFLEFETIRDYDHIGVYGLDPKYTPKDQPSWLDWSFQLIRNADKHLKVGGTLLFGGDVLPRWWMIMYWLREVGYETLFEREVDINNRKCIKLGLRKGEEQ